MEKEGIATNSRISPLNSLRGRFVILFIFAILIPTGIFGGTAYVNGRNTLRQNAINQISSTANSKQGEITSWLEERQSDARLLANNLLNQDHLQVILEDGAPKVEKILYEQFLIDNLMSFQEERLGYLEILIVDQEGETILSTNRNSEYLNVDKSFVEQVRTGASEEYYDIQPSDDSSPQEIWFAHAMHEIDMASMAMEPNVIGILIIRVALQESLFTPLLNWDMVGSTGEIYITSGYGEDTQLLTKLQFDSNELLGDSNIFSNGHFGLTETDRESIYLDYRGEKTLAVYVNVPNTDWQIIVKQDLAEAYRPIQNLSSQWAIGLVISLVGGIYIATKIADRETKPVTKLRDAALEIATGNYSAPVDILAKGEVGDLAAAFTKMSAAVVNRDTHLREHASEVETLFSLSQEFLKIQDNDKILNFSLAYCQQITPNIFPMIFLSDSDTMPLTNNPHGGWDELTTDGSLYRHGFEGPAQQAIALKTAIIDENIYDDLPGSIQAKLKKQHLASIAVPMLVGEKVIGAFWILSQKNSGGWDHETIQLITLVANQTAIAFARAKLFQDLIDSYDRTLDALANALDTRDQETEGHSRRVVSYTLALAREMNIDEALLPTIQRGALLHDIGKIGIPDAILHKAGPLTQAEFEIMKTHPQLGKHILSGIPQLMDASEIVHTHHERWNGSGYPRGLTGIQIPLGARIFALADTYDAITSDRPYRAAGSYEDARKEILIGSGSQFDPAVVDAFIRIPKNIWNQHKQPDAATDTKLNYLALVAETLV